MTNPIRIDIIDALKAQGYAVSYRGFLNSRGDKLLAVDPIADEVDTVRAVIDAAFPMLTTEIISCEPYRALRRIIVKGFAS